MNYRKIRQFVNEAEALQVEINNYYALLGGDNGIIYNNKEVREVIETKIEEIRKDKISIDEKIKNLIE